MSLVIHYENGKLIKSEQNYIRTTPSPIYLSEDGKTFIMGEVFGASYKDIINTNWMDDPFVLDNFQGAISVSYADENRCVFASDMNGIEIWYVYHKDKTFILSDNFWDIVKIIQPSLDDIDRERARMTLLSPSAYGDTLIKNLKFLLPSMIGEYIPITNTLSMKKYREFKYSGEVSDVNVAVEHVDAILDDTMSNLKNKFGNVKYGLGVSGGLDSRIIPHYAKKHNMELVGYNLCVPRPRGIFLAQSCKNAEKISGIYDIPLTFVKWNANTVNEKIATKVMYYPLGASRNSFKYDESLDFFDIMLNGGAGEIVGGALPANIEDLTEQQLFGIMKEFFSSVYYASSFKARASRAMKFIFGSKKETRSLSAICLLLDKNDIENVENEIYCYIKHGKKIGQTNTEIYEDFMINICSSRNRFGGFESMLGQNKSFSIYIPFLLGEVMTWDQNLLYNRKVLNELILQKIPEVKDVQSELFSPAPGKKVTVINKITGMLSFLIRGNGTAIDQYWIKKRSVKKCLKRRLSNGCSWFFDVFNTNEKELTKLVFDSKEAPFMINVWEYKTLVDVIETKEYLNFDFSEET